MKTYIIQLPDRTMTNPTALEVMANTSYTPQKYRLDDPERYMNMKYASRCAMISAAMGELSGVRSYSTHKTMYHRMEDASATYKFMDGDAVALELTCPFNLDPDEHRRPSNHQMLNARDATVMVMIDKKLREYEENNPDYEPHLEFDWEVDDETVVITEKSKMPTEDQINKVAGELLIEAQAKQKLLDAGLPENLYHMLIQDGEYEVDDLIERLKK